MSTRPNYPPTFDDVRVGVGVGGIGPGDVNSILRADWCAVAEALADREHAIVIRDIGNLREIGYPTFGENPDTPTVTGHDLA